jgi:ABC-2 type transport system ATP-binding protein
MIFDMASGGSALHRLRGDRAGVPAPLPNGGDGAGGAPDTPATAALADAVGPPDAQMAIVVAELRKRYGDFEAVRGVDFAVRRGEVFGLLGPNGAGKTTIVEILEGYRARTGGTVSVLGFDPGERPRALRERVGIVLQSTGIYRHITVREALRHWSGLYPHPRDVEEVLALSGLQAKQDERTSRLSGGQLRRLDLALALIGDPDLIFLDEPTTGFDPGARRAAWDTIRALRDLGKTVLLTTHYLDEAQALADRVAIIKDGRILAEGTPTELGVGQSTSYRVSHRDEHGRLVTQETDDPTRLLYELTAATLARGERLRELSVVRPSLEDVYLELTAGGDTDGEGAEKPVPGRRRSRGRARGRAGRQP